MVSLTSEFSSISIQLKPLVMKVMLSQLPLSSSHTACTFKKYCVPGVRSCNVKC